MSGASPKDKFSGSARNIPIRRMVLEDPSLLPSDYSTTPGGTMFSTTPGGTRIIYDRAFLLQCRNSPLTKTPPANLPDIPGITRVAPEGSNTIKENGHVTAAQPQQQQQQQPSPAAQRQAESKTNENPDEPQFEMDI